MITGPLQDLCRECHAWLMTKPARLCVSARTGELSRKVHAAVGAEYEARRNYDAELDHRVMWLRSLISTARVGRPQPDVVLTAIVEMELFPLEEVER